MNFTSLLEVAKDLQAEMTEVYWVLLPLVLVGLIVLEIIKSENEPIQIGDILKRVIVSVLLLYSFEWISSAIGLIGDGIIAKISPYNESWAVIKELTKGLQEGSRNMFDVKSHMLFALSYLSYMVAYLGFFMAEAMTHFVWIVLHVVSPLMILAYIYRGTASITHALYWGLAKVVIWKVLWLVLGAILLKFAQLQDLNNQEYLTTISINFCIGLSMLFIPIATNSLLGSGMETSASSMGMTPLRGVQRVIKVKTMGLASRAARGGKNIARSIRRAK